MILICPHCIKYTYNQGFFFKKKNNSIWQSCIALFCKKMGNRGPPFLWQRNGGSICYPVRETLGRLRAPRAWSGLAVYTKITYPVVAAKAGRPQCFTLDSTPEKEPNSKAAIWPFLKYVCLISHLKMDEYFFLSCSY